MSLRLITPFLALMVTSQLSAAEKPEGDRPQGPQPGALFERFDQDGDHLLSRPEFIRGMIALHRHRHAGDHDRPHRPEGAGDGEGRPHPPGAGEGRPHPHPPGAGEGRPQRPAGGGEGRPQRPQGEGHGRPHPPGAGEDRPHGDGEGRPRPDGDGEARRPLAGGPLEKVFEKADADKSGTLTLEEFRSALQNMPKPPAHRPHGHGEGERPEPAKEQ